MAVHAHTFRGWLPPSRQRCSAALLPVTCHACSANSTTHHRLEVLSCSAGQNVSGLVLFVHCSSVGVSLDMKESGHGVLRPRCWQSRRMSMHALCCPSWHISRVKGFKPLGFRPWNPLLPAEPAHLSARAPAEGSGARAVRARGVTGGPRRGTPWRGHRQRYVGRNFAGWLGPACGCGGGNGQRRRRWRRGRVLLVQPLVQREPA